MQRFEQGEDVVLSQDPVALGEYHSSETPLIPRFHQQGYDAKSIQERREWVQEKTGCVLTHVGLNSVEGTSMRGNIENPIGTVQVPLGVAGPLLVHGSFAKGIFYVPLATTE